MLQAIYKYEVEVEFVKIEHVQQQFRYLQKQCEQMEHKYQTRMKQEINRLYDRQLILLQLSRRKWTKYKYQ